MKKDIQELLDYISKTKDTKNVYTYVEICAYTQLRLEKLLKEEE